MRPDLSDPEHFGLLFALRSHHAPLLIGAEDVWRGSRIGGRAPDVIRPEAMRGFGEDLTYFLTLGSDVLGALVEENLELSFFYRRHEAARLGGNPRDARDTLAVFPHGPSQRAAERSDLDSPLRGRALSVGDLSSDRDERGLVFLGSKLGGMPGLIQDEEIYLEPVRSRGLEFLFQISEESFPADMVTGSYVFYDGAVYVFTRFGASRRIDPSEVGSFWQN